MDENEVDLRIALQGALVNRMKDAKAVWKAFLQTAPPNTSRTIGGLAFLHNDNLARKSWRVMKPPQIELHSERDNGIRRFDTDQEAISLAGL